MDILPSPKSHDKATSSNAKRRSASTDFASLKPLKPDGALGFSTFRDTNDRSTSYESAKKSSKDDNDMNSDDDDDVEKDKTVKQKDTDIPESGISALAPDVSEGLQALWV